MPTNLPAHLYLRYQVMDVWSRCHRSSMPEQRKFILELFGRWEKYQAAKQRLFEPDSKGNLPLVTEELAQDICKKYDALLDYYKYYTCSLPQKIVKFFYSHLSPRGWFSHSFCLLGQIDELIEHLQQEDGASVEWLREHFRKRLDYVPVVDNIEKLSELARCHPFDTEKTEQAKAERNPSVKTCSRKDHYEDFCIASGGPNKGGCERQIKRSKLENKAKRPKGTEVSENPRMGAPESKEQKTANAHSARNKGQLQAKRAKAHKVQTKGDRDQIMVKRLVAELKNVKFPLRSNVARPQTNGTTRFSKSKVNGAG